MMRGWADSGCDSGHGCLRAGRVGVKCGRKDRRWVAGSRVKTSEGRCGDSRRFGNVSRTSHGVRVRRVRRPGAPSCQLICRGDWYREVDFAAEVMARWV